MSDSVVERKEPPQLQPRLLTPRERITEPAPIPSPMTPFVGRQAEVTGAADRVRRDDVRLVTLTGPPGVGKTRLAIQVANIVRPAFPDGVRFIGLGAVSDADLVMPTIARALGAWERPGRTVSQVVADVFEDQRALLVLDDFDQVHDAGSDVIRLLGRCPRLTILVTSRALLHVSGEHAFSVPPMPVPGSGTLGIPAEITEVDSVQLFVQRAGAARAGWTLEPEDAAVVAEICRRLDGVPLALELAAARVAHLSARAILARLESILSLLTGGPADVPSRSRTMRDAISVSYRLLTDHEQEALQGISVFVGGCTLEAIAATTNDQRAGGEGTLDLVSALLDSGLLLRTDGADGEPRYSMLESIREYCWSELTRSGNENPQRQAQADWCLVLAERAATRLVGAEQRLWFDRLEAELPNIRQALTFEAGRSAQRNLRIVGAMAMLWYVRNHLHEGTDLVERALGNAGDAVTPARSLALRAAGMMALASGGYPLAVSRLEQSLAISRELDDHEAVGHASFWLALIAEYQGDDRGAQVWFREALALYREVGDDMWTALTLGNLGDTACRQGDLDGAEAFCREGLELALVVGDRYVLWNNRQVWGNLNLARGNWDGAVAAHWQEITLAYEIGDMRGVADGLAGIGGAAVGRGHASAGTRILGAADQLRSTIGRNLLPSHAQIAMAMSAARSALGGIGFETAFEAGRAWSVDEAIEAARQQTSRSLVARADPETAQGKGPTRQLTARELDVLGLLVNGDTDKEIAAALVISRRTAAGHVASIMDKLGARSRTEAAVNAVRLGLA